MRRERYACPECDGILRDDKIPGHELRDSRFVCRKCGEVFYLVDSDFYHEEVYTELYDFSDWHPNETGEEFWDHEDVW